VPKIIEVVKVVEKIIQKTVVIEVEKIVEKPFEKIII
jgi:hypothetical protein